MIQITFSLIVLRLVKIFRFKKIIATMNNDENGPINLCILKINLGVRSIKLSGGPPYQPGESDCVIKGILRKSRVKLLT